MPPGKEGKIELAVEHTAGYTGELSKGATVRTNDPANYSFYLTLRARFLGGPPIASLPPRVATPPKPNSTVALPPVAPPKPASAFMVEPTAQWISTVLVGSATSNTLYLVANDSKPVHVKQLVLNGTDFTATVNPIQDGRRYELRVATNPNLKPGLYKQTLVVWSDRPTAAETPIHLEVTVFPKVFVSPRSIMMPKLPAGDNAAAVNWPSISVRKVREAGLKITAFSSTLPFLKLELVTETEGQVYKILLKVDPAKIKPGEFKGMVRIETNEPETLVVEVPIQGSFTDSTPTQIQKAAN